MPVFCACMCVCVCVCVSLRLSAAHVHTVRLEATAFDVIIQHGKEIP